MGIAWRLSLKPVLLSTTPGPSRNFEAGNVEIRSDNSLMGNVATRRIFIEQGAVVSGVIDVRKPSEKGKAGARAERATALEGADLERGSMGRSNVLSQASRRRPGHPAMRPRGLLEAGGVEVAIPLKFFRAESETQRKPTPIQVRYG